MPSEASMPRRSSGEVSTRQRMTFVPLRSSCSATLAEKTTCPEAAPGPAGRPRPMSCAFLRPWGSNTGTRSDEMESAGMR